MDLALDNLQRLICHKNPTNQPIKLSVCSQLCELLFSSSLHLKDRELIGIIHYEADIKRYYLLSNSKACQ